MSFLSFAQLLSPPTSAHCHCPLSDSVPALSLDHHHLLSDLSASSGVPSGHRLLVLTHAPDLVCLLRGALQQLPSSVPTPPKHCTTAQKTRPFPKAPLPEGRPRPQSPPSRGPGSPQALVQPVPGASTPALLFNCLTAAHTPGPAQTSLPPGSRPHPLS